MRSTVEYRRLSDKLDAVEKLAQTIALQTQFVGRMALTLAEVATVCGVSLDSVHRARRRTGALKLHTNCAFGRHTVTVTELQRLFAVTSEPFSHSISQKNAA